MTTSVSRTGHDEPMKAIFEAQLWVVVDDESDGVWLESGGEPTARVFAPYSSDDLVVDPTDDEVERVLGSSSVRQPELG